MMYTLKVEPDEKTGLPGLEATFGRITVLMGANGSGKSKLLRALRDQHANSFEALRKVVFVEGGRAVSLPTDLKLARATVQNFSEYSTARSAHTSKRAGKLTERVADALFTLERKAAEDKGRHSDAVADWQKTDRSTTCPTREEPALDQLFRLVEDVLPHLRLALSEDRLLLALRGERSYSIAELSDGEKQALAILADIAMLTPPKEPALILVDEPELNLHPSLASTLWSGIEAELPEAVFVYATHSLSFAMRREVNQVIVVSAQNGALELGEPGALDPGELRPFLGSIPAILTASRVLLVEGDDNSFDRLFFQWLVQDDVDVVSVGGCRDVSAASKRAGLWAKLAPALCMAGIIDRDYRTDELLDNLASANCEWLEFHEAESYLCDPTLLANLGEGLGFTAAPLSAADLASAIQKRFDETILEVAAKRTCERLAISSHVSIPSHVLAKVNDEAAMAQLLQRQAESEMARVDRQFDDNEIARILKAEVASCRAISSSGDTKAMRRLAPGKELLAELAARMGFKSSQQVLTTARLHIKAVDYPDLLALKNKLSALLDVNGRES